MILLDNSNKNNVLISCKNLTAGYDSKIILKNISFDICEGDYICIAGENGTGKSTLVKTLTGIIPFKSGHLHYLNIKKNQIGYLPQQSLLNPDFPATVFEVVLSGTLSQKGPFPFYTKKLKELALNNLKLIGMENFKNSPFANLSGGQKQRVLLARALCATQKLLVLDEPVTGLDPIVTNDFYKLIQNLNQKLKISIIMVSHDVSSAVKYAKKILHLTHNGCLFCDTADYLKTNIGKRFSDASEDI